MKARVARCAAACPCGAFEVVRVIPGSLVDCARCGEEIEAVSIEPPPKRGDDDDRADE